eukprot:SAG22_NODE_596_length_8727_cov_107.360338_7_plen_117_part_00
MELAHELHDLKTAGQIDVAAAAAKAKAEAEAEAERANEALRARTRAQEGALAKDKAVAVAKEGLSAVGTGALSGTVFLDTSSPCVLPPNWCPGLASWGTQGHGSCWATRSSSVAYV